MTWLYRSMVKNSTTFTVPAAHTRPRSLRPRSTSITCSLRSLASDSRSLASSTSSSSVAPRGRVPAIGCMVTNPSRTVTSASGDDPTTAIGSPSGVGSRNRYMYGLGLVARNTR